MRVSSKVTRVSVPGTAAIFLAGRIDVAIAAPGPPPAGYPLTRNTFGGTGPYSETFPVKIDTETGEVFQFSASGKLTLDVLFKTVHSTPDGAGYSNPIRGVAGISNYNGPEGALVGVFLNDTNPEKLPPPVESIPASANTAASNSLTPNLNQVFFIGTGTSATGTVRGFQAPKGATRLFLGVADVGVTGDAGGYDDNAGSFEVGVTATGVR